MKAVFVLALICAVAYANNEEQHAQEHHQEQQEAHHHHHPHGHHHHHGHHNHSVCQLDDEPLSRVLACVQEKLAEEVKAKLNAVQESLQCADILCGIRKVCQSNGGTLEGNRGNQSSVFTEEQNTQLRSAFYDCRPSDAAHAHLGEAAPATDVPTEA
ncbi:uncharacterized protein LOC144140915 [Haemaphysalis longicornis]